MDGERNLEREIESLLAVEPSPEFLARVRARVAAEPAPGGWGLTWMLGVAGAAVAIGIAVMLWPSAEVSPQSAPTFERPQVAEVVRPPAPPASPAVAPVRRTPTAEAAPAAAVRRIEIDLPEVVLAENEVKAYSTLVASVGQRRFDAVVPPAPDPGVPLAVAELPPVEPLEIEPIVRVAGLQAEGERP